MYTIIVTCLISGAYQGAQNWTHNHPLCQKIDNLIGKGIMIYYTNGIIQKLISAFGINERKI